MVKQLKLINDFYYCRPGKGALSSNTCYYNISSRGSVINNSYIFKNKKFISIDKNITKLKLQLYLRKTDLNDGDIHIVNMKLTS